MKASDEMLLKQLPQGQEPQQTLAGTPETQGDRCRSAPTSPCDQGTHRHTPTHTHTHTHGKRTTAAELARVCVSVLRPDAKEPENIRKALSFGEEQKTPHALSSPSSDAAVAGDGEGGRANGEVGGHTAPQTRRVNLPDFVFIKVLGKGSFGKVSAGSRPSVLPALHSPWGAS